MQSGLKLIVEFLQQRAQADELFAKQLIKVSKHGIEQQYSGFVTGQLEVVIRNFVGVLESHSRQLELRVREWGYDINIFQRI